MVLYPFLFAIIPILHIYVFNSDQLSFGDILIPMAISFSFALVSFIILRFLLKNSKAAGTIVSLLLVLFYSFGYFAEFIGATRKAMIALWLPVFGAVFVAGLLLIIKYRERLRNLTIILNVVAVSLIVLVLINLILGGNLVGKPSVKPMEPNDVTKEIRKASPKTANQPELPDIYYIILDAYSSNQVLQNYMDYDNSDFTQWLEQKGFYVAYDCYSNYSNTVYSLASSLNLVYLDKLKNQHGLKPVRRMINENTLAQILKSRGYKYAYIGSDYYLMQSSRHADIIYPKTLINREFLYTMLGTTALRPLMGEQVQVISRKTVLGAFSRITSVRQDIDGPLFVFAHIPIPHPPYIFDRNGNPPKRAGQLSMDMYLEQLTFVSKKTREVVDRILSQSKKPPVIVIQADHGIGTLYVDIKKKRFAGYELESVFGALNAYYIPGDRSGMLYRSISPVNSFRFVLNSLFGTDLKLLKDRSYLWGLDNQYNFRDVTDSLRGGH